MRKSLMLVLALALVAGLSVAAYAEVQNVKVSGDLTVLGIGRNLSLTPNLSQTSKYTETSVASIARVKVDADLTDNVMTTVRFLNERYWGRSTDNTDVTGSNTDVALDLAYVPMKEFLYSPLTLTIGRQELHLGSEMIVGDPDTNNVASTASVFGNVARADDDLSARKAFDAIRATLNYDPLVIEAIASKIRQVSLNRTVGTATNNDEMLYGVTANYKLGKKDIVLEGYWFERDRGRVNATIAPKKAADRTDVLGARITAMPIEDLSVSGEAAYQFGKMVPTTVGQPIEPRNAWAAEASAAYNFKKVKYTPMAKALYCYFSGARNPTDTFRAWDPMYENQTFGNIVNELFNQTNMHIFGGIVTAKATDDITLKGEFYGYWWAKTPIDGSTITTARDTTINLNNRQRATIGQELDLTATYDYTEDVQFSILGGWFFPGATFAKDNNSVADEVIGSMKVTF